MTSSWSFILQLKHHVSEAWYASETLWCNVFDTSDTQWSSNEEACICSTKEHHSNPAVASRACSQTVSKPVWHIPLLCVQWKTPDDGQRNCSKHVEFYSKNKFEKLVHLVGFIIRIYHDARSPERQIFHPQENFYMQFYGISCGVS